jgi:hypothetical protein
MRFLSMAVERCTGANYFVDGEDPIIKADSEVRPIKMGLGSLRGHCALAQHARGTNVHPHVRDMNSRVQTFTLVRMCRSSVVLQSPRVIFYCPAN